jgi:hypothetical protein
MVDEVSTLLLIEGCDELLAHVVHVSEEQLKGANDVNLAHSQ